MIRSSLDAFESASSRSNFEHHKIYSVALNIVAQVQICKACLYYIFASYWVKLAHYCKYDKYYLIIWSWLC